jgi:hypothetical protein
LIPLNCFSVRSGFSSRRQEKSVWLQLPEPDPSELPPHLIAHEGGNRADTLEDGSLPIAVDPGVGQGGVCGDDGSDGQSEVQLDIDAGRGHQRPPTAQESLAGPVVVHPDHNLATLQNPRARQCGHHTLAELERLLAGLVGIIVSVSGSNDSGAVSGSVVLLDVHHVLLVWCSEPGSVPCSLYYSNGPSRTHSL